MRYNRQSTCEVQHESRKDKHASTLKEHHIFNATSHSTDTYKRAVVLRRKLQLHLTKQARSAIVHSLCTLGLPGIIAPPFITILFLFLSVSPHFLTCAHSTGWPCWSSCIRAWGLLRYTASSCGICANTCIECVCLCVC